MPVLEVTNLHKAYGQLKAVDGVNFSIEAGEIFGLLGPNGAGKSTTINMIATLLMPDEGRIVLNDHLCSTSPQYKRGLGYVPQEISLSERLTARENLMLIGRLYDLGGVELAKRVDGILEAIGLKDRSRDLVSTFSGGMKRRLNIGAALLHKPDLLLMDEPTAGVDPQARAYIFEIVERLAEQGRGVLYTTHYMEEAERLCRRTAIIDRGRILATGTLAELTRNVKARRDLVIEAEGLTEGNVARLAAKLDNVPWSLDNGTAHLHVAGTKHTLLNAVRAADEVGLQPNSIRILEPNLENVFLDLTGRALRD